MAKAIENQIAEKLEQMRRKAVEDEIMLGRMYKELYMKYPKTPEREKVLKEKGLQTRPTVNKLIKKYNDSVK